MMVSSLYLAVVASLSYVESFSKTCLNIFHEQKNHLIYSRMSATLYNFTKILV